MTRLTNIPLAVGADYHDALVAARRAKSGLFLLMMLFLLAQIAIFFLVRFNVIDLRPPTDAPSTISVPMTTTMPASMTSESSTKTSVDKKQTIAGLLAWVTNSIVYLGTILSLILPVILLLIILVMLCGRLLGVSHVISAFVWAIVLAAVLFPWQNFYGPDSSPTAVETLKSAPSDFRIPGVLYTWGEFHNDVHFEAKTSSEGVLKWARFVGFPVIALIVLFMVQAKSGRGVKYALGEADVQIDVSSP